MIWQRAIAGFGDICVGDRNPVGTTPKAIALHLSHPKASALQSAIVEFAITLSQVRESINVLVFSHD